MSEWHTGPPPQTMRFSKRTQECDTWFIEHKTIKLSLRSRAWWWVVGPFLSKRVVKLRATIEGVQSVHICPPSWRVTDLETVGRWLHVTCEKNHA
jgi:hypothetical protein